MGSIEATWQLILNATAGETVRSVGSESPTVPAASPAGERLRCVSRALR